MKGVGRVVCALVLLGASSPTLAQVASGATSRQQLPPIIDRELFFGDPEIAGGQLSPNGRFVSFRKPYKNVMNIWVKRVTEPFDAARPITADTTRPVSGYFWSEDSKFVLYVQDKGGNENYHVYAVDPTAAAETATGVPPARDLTPYENVRAFIYAVPENTPGSIIVGLNDRDAQVHDVYRVSLTTGERELILTNSENIAGWTTDLDGQLRLGTRVGPDGGTEILRVDGETLTQVYGCSNEETCAPIRFHKDGRRVYLITNQGAPDLIRLVLFDPATKAEELVEADPEHQVDFAGAEFSDATEEITATYYLGDRLRIYPKTASFARDLELLRSRLPQGEIYFGSATEDESLQLVTVTRDVDPGSVYLFDRKAGSVSLLYRGRPNLPIEQLAPMQAVRYTARDGLEIPAYLTVPKGAEPRDLPVVILPHGGPWARDAWGYDPYAQFLANRGYAVLQPNFRGSTGYGKKFLNAGNKQWGTGAMQHDITDGVRYLVDRGLADPERVGIFGGSYGGYATLAGLAFTPDVYAAGVSYVGPSNIITLLNSIPPYWAPVKKMFAVRVGDVDDPADRARLVEQSPLNSARQIQAPLLVIQGANDPRVKKAESEQIVVALRELGRPVEYLLAEDEGHGFAGRENRLAVAVSLENFFAKHLGGRAQEAMPTALAQKLAALTVDPRTVELTQPPVAVAGSGTAPLPAANGNALQATTLTYNLAMQVMGREMAATVTRAVQEAQIDGRATWRLTDVTQLPMGTSADTVWMDRTTLQPIRRSAGGGGTLMLTFGQDAITGEMSGGGQKMPISQKLTAPVFGEGAALEAVLAGLPLAEGYQATVRIFEALTQRVRPVAVAVTGIETVTTSAGTFPTLVVTVTPLDGDEGGTGTLHVRQQAPHHVIRSTYKLPAMMGGGTATSELTSITGGR